MEQKDEIKDATHDEPKDDSRDEIKDDLVKNAQIVETVARILAHHKGVIVFVYDGKAHWNIHQYPKPTAPYELDPFDWGKIGIFVEKIFKNQLNSSLPDIKDETNLTFVDLHLHEAILHPANEPKTAISSIHFKMHAALGGVATSLSTEKANALSFTMTYEQFEQFFKDMMDQKLDCSGKIMILV